jgi:hypothetical protein
MSGQHMQFCYFCGAELGVYEADPRDRDTCGAVECNRAARADIEAEREDAHEQLDRDRGWT